MGNDYLALFLEEWSLEKGKVVPLHVKAMTHRPTQMLSRVGSGPVGVCVIGLQLDFLLHSSLVPDCLVGSRRPYDSTVELGWVMCYGLKAIFATATPS